MFCLGVLLAVSLSGQVSCAEVPEHKNHTNFVPGQKSISWGELTIHFLAVGDVDGARRMVVWVLVENPSNRMIYFSPSAMNARADDGEPRPVVHQCASIPGGRLFCGRGIERTKWLSSPVTVDPKDTLSCWVVFEFSKSEFESMEILTLNYIGSELDIAISATRGPAVIPALNVVWPRQGGRYTEANRVIFQIHDRYVNYNFTVTIDGVEIGRGSMILDDHICPKEMKIPLSVDIGYHTAVISVSSGDNFETSTINFIIDPDEEPDLDVKWVFNTSDALGGVFGSGHRSGFTGWDVDDDDVRELIFGTREGQSKRIWCIDARGTFEWIYPPIEKEGLLGNPTTKASLLDLDGNGVHEICLAGDGGRLHVLNPDGSVYWIWDNPRGVRPASGPPQAMDVDGDGQVEFFLVDDTGYLYRIEHTGKTVWNRTVTGGSQGTPTLADIDGDGVIEIMWTSFEGYIWCVSSQDGETEWRYRHQHGFIESPVMVLDIDGDREYEALSWTGGPPFQVLVLDPEGREAASWTSPYMDKVRFGQALGDIDRDGVPELVLVSGTTIYCLGFQGRQPYTKWERNLERWLEQGSIPEGAMLTDWSSNQLIADIDGDGEQEILLAIPYPIVMDGATGSLESYYIDDYVRTLDRHTTGSWWGDIDDDGMSEWVVELRGWYHQQTRVYCLTMGGQFPAPSPWPEFHHCAYPADYQAQEEWLTLKAAGSNSLWFTEIPEVTGPSILFMMIFPAIAQFISLLEGKDSTTCES